MGACATGKFAIGHIFGATKTRKVSYFGQFLFCFCANLTVFTNSYSNYKIITCTCKFVVQ